MKLSLSASQLVASTTLAALVTPFAELEHFISLCDTPTQILPHHTFDNTLDKSDLYIVVPTPTKYSKPFPSIFQFPQPMGFRYNDKHADKMMVQSRVSFFAFLDPRTFFKFLQQVIFPSITSFIIYTTTMVKFVFHMASFMFASFFGLLKMIAGTGFRVLVNIAMTFWSIFKLISLLIFKPVIFTTDLIFRIYKYIGSIPLINLYLKPIFYLTMLSALVGSVIGFCVGYIIIVIRQLIPITSNKSKQNSAVSNMVKTFENSLSTQRPTLRFKSHVPSTTKIKSKPISDLPAKTILVAVPAVIDPIESPTNPVPLPIAVSINHTDSSASVNSLSGKHKAYTSDYEEENEKLKLNSLDNSFRKIQSSDEIEPYVGYAEMPPVTPPLYEDEDGYSNYFIQSSSEVLEDIESNTPAVTPKIQSPVSETNSVVNNNEGFSSTTLSESADVHTEDETRNIGDDDTILETLKIPVREISYTRNFESITEEGD